MTNAKISVTHVEDTRPVKQVKVANSTGYFDNILNLNKNGKAIRISNRFGEGRVMVTLDSVDALIDALKLVKAKGVKTSAEEVKYDAKATTGLRRRA